MKSKQKISSGPVMNGGRLGLLADVLIWAVLFVCMFIAIIPMWHTLMCSLSDGQLLQASEGIRWSWLTSDGTPNMAGYIKTVNYSDHAILRSYAVTLLYVAGNVLFGLIINVTGGYVLYRKPKAYNVMTIFIMLTMMFSGGMIPLYMVVRKLGLTGSPFSLMLPGCTNAMFVIVEMNAFNQVPASTVEAAEIDGASHFTIMFRILLPQALGLTVVNIINTAIIAWNAWFDASIYIPNVRDWWPL